MFAFKLGNPQPPGLHIFLNTELKAHAFCYAFFNRVSEGFTSSPTSSPVNLFRYGFSQSSSSKRYQKRCKYFWSGSSHCVYGLSHIHQYVADHCYSLMGPTGSGRSNVRTILCYTLVFIFLHALKIIDTLAGQPGRRSGNRLESCTTEVRAVRLYKHPVHGDRLVLVDTPGFDDTNKSDLEILQTISNWLQKM